MIGCLGAAWCGVPVALGQGAEGGSRVTSAELAQVYGRWRAAMISRDLGAWQAATARHRQIEIRNRIFSERRSVGQALFDLPGAPPALEALKALWVRSEGVTAKAFYFGKVDFGVGGAPSDNLLVLSFVREGKEWKYDTADFVNLSALPEVRKQLAAGNLQHLDRAEFAPPGRVTPPRVQLRGPVKYIAKTYVYCPGREVRVQINKVSSHLFQNTKAAEVVIGGARDGRNEVQYSIRQLPGGEGAEPLTIRVYLLSQVRGVKPIKIFEYQVGEKERPEPVGTGYFAVTREVVRRLMGR